MEENKNNTVAAPATKEEAKTTKPARQARNAKKGIRTFSRPREEKEYEEKVIKISRVAKVISGGKRMRFTALVVVGDGKGNFGFGLGKSSEVPEAIKKGLNVAKNRRSIKHFPIIDKGETIPHIVIGKYNKTMVYLKPAPEGTGLIAGGATRSILELAGVKNVYSKIYGSRKAINVVKATADALSQLTTYAEVMKIRHGVDVTAKAK